MRTERQRENVRAFKERRVAMKQRTPIYIPERAEDEFAFMDYPVAPRRSYGRSSSNPGRICRTAICREFVADLKATCPHCGAKP
jgi:hypothetical protein